MVKDNENGNLMVKDIAIQTIKWKLFIASCD